MPGKKPTLHVVGVCTFPTGGYSVELRPRQPQGSTPSIYILDKVIHEPDGPVPQVITAVPVHYREQTSAKYAQVTIEPDHQTVDVREVS